MDTIILEIEIHSDGTEFGEKRDIAIIPALIDRCGFIGNIIVEPAYGLPVSDVCEVSHIAIEDNLYPLRLLHQLVDLTGLLTSDEHHCHEGQEYTKYCAEHALKISQFLTGYGSIPYRLRIFGDMVPRMMIPFLLVPVLMGCRTPTTGQSDTESNSGDDITVLAEDLEVPWGLDELPDGHIIFTERNGRISLLDPENGNLTLFVEREIEDVGEGGLLGIAVDPAYTENGYIYIYETISTGNRIVRLDTDSGQYTGETVLVRGIPHAWNHDGGILRFGPDGYLYAGTGDAAQPGLAQDTASLAGKILRMDRNGEPAPGNPFGTLVYSYGHRNVQGVTWDKEGNMYASEHGPSGELNGWCCHDELNLIQPGGNYGWPLVIGDKNCEGCILPLAHSGNDTWAPGGILFIDEQAGVAWQQSILMACLRGRKLIVWNKDGTMRQVMFDRTYKRIRNIIRLSDGSLLMATSNRDGREALPNRKDDRLFLIVLQ